MYLNSVSSHIGKQWHWQNKRKHFTYEKMLTTEFLRCIQSLDPPSGHPLLDPILAPLLDHSIFLVKIKNNKLKLYNMCATYHHSLKEGVPLHATHFPRLCLKFPRRTRIFSAIRYLGIFCETCHF